MSHVVEPGVEPWVQQERTTSLESCQPPPPSDTAVKMSQNVSVLDNAQAVNYTVLRKASQQIHPDTKKSLRMCSAKLEGGRGEFKREEIIVMSPSNSRANLYHIKGERLTIQL